MNVLVNYWWRGAVGSTPARVDSALDCLVHSVLNLRRLPPAQRAAWRAIFDYYVFDAGVDPAGHIPPHKHGVLGDMPDAHADQVRAFLVGKLQQR